MAEAEKKPQGVHDALAQIGMTVEELEAADQELYLSGKAQRRSRDNRVCACGHRASAHTVVGGVAYCRPTKLECPCKALKPVLEVQDTRCFNFKTEGSGALHALGRGLLACVKREKAVRWIVELQCERCGKEAERLIPTAVSQRGQAVAHATGFDALLCEDCRREV
jgi:hypothetical protein